MTDRQTSIHGGHCEHSKTCCEDNTNKGMWSTLGHDDHRHRDEQESAIERDEFRSASLGQSRQCGKANASLCEESTY